VLDLPARRPPNGEHSRTSLPARPRQLPSTQGTRRVATSLIRSTLSSDGSGDRFGGQSLVRAS
jgi:hypothetical protein